MFPDRMGSEAGGRALEKELLEIEGGVGDG